MNNYEDMSKLTKQGTFISRVSQTGKVMVVDDQPLSLLHAVDLINYEGYEVIESVDSTQALSLAYVLRTLFIAMMCHDTAFAWYNLVHFFQDK